MQAEIGVEVDKQLGAKADKPMQSCELKKMTLKELLALQDLQPWRQATITESETTLKQV